MKQTVIAAAAVCTALLFILSAISPAPVGQPEPRFSGAGVASSTMDGQMLPAVNRSVLYGYLSGLVGFGPRVTGTPACRAAAEYIYREFEQLGLQVSYHDWTARGNLWHPGRYDSQNVIATLPGGSDATIIFNAHYDTVEGTVGADDDASGVAAVLAAAHALHDRRFNHTVTFVALSGEEEGLLGSHAYARDLYTSNASVIVEFNADMIGHANTSEGGRSFRMYGTEDTVWIRGVVEDVNAAMDIDFDLVNGSIGREGQGGSDYASFAHYGYEAVAFFEKEWNPYMHEPGDDLDNVNMSYLYNTTALITGTIAALADMPLHPQVTLETPRRDAVYLDGEAVLSSAGRRSVIVGDCTVTARAWHGSLEQVDFYLGDVLVHTDTAAPYTWDISRPVLGERTLRAVATDMAGRSSEDYLPVFFLHPLPR